MSPSARALISFHCRSLPVELTATFAGAGFFSNGSVLLIDRLKTDAPFWKRAQRGGDSCWVDARDSDDAASARWVEVGPAYGGESDAAE